MQAILRSACIVAVSNSDSEADNDKIGLDNSKRFLGIAACYGYKSDSRWIMLQAALKIVQNAPETDVLTLGLGCILKPEVFPSPASVL